MPGSLRERLEHGGRLTALRRTGLLDRAPDPVFERLARMASRLIGAPVALVSLVLPDRQSFQCAVGVGEPWATDGGTPLSHSFCQHVVATEEPLVVRDAREHPLLRDSAAIADLRAVAYAGLPLRSADGYVIGTFCVIDHVPRDWTDDEIGLLTDLTELVTARIRLFEEAALRTEGEASQRAADAQLQRAQKLEAIGQLAGGIAHDFNNLMSVVLMNVELVRGDPDAQRWEAELGEVRFAAERATQLTRQLLAFARQRVLQPEPTSLAVSLAENQHLLQRLLDPRYPIVIDAADDRCRVMVDPSQLTQVLLNLVSNARDAMPNGGTVTLRARCVDLGAAATEWPDAPPGRYAALDVIDQGVGMDRATLARVFEPFFTTKPPGQGTGLGLATVYGVVEQSGGRVAIESAPGRGTRVSVLLPCIDDAAAPAAPDVTPVVRQRVDATLLLVDDETGLRSALRRLLQRDGYRVLEASDGEEALRILDERRAEVDLMLTDVVMPRMDGYELAHRCRERWADLPVLVMSGHDERAGGGGQALPAEVFIEKPFELADLRARLRLLLPR